MTLVQMFLGEIISLLLCIKTKVKIAEGALSIEESAPKFKNCKSKHQSY